MANWEIHLLQSTVLGLPVPGHGQPAPRKKHGRSASVGHMGASRRQKPSTDDRTGPAHWSQVALYYLPWHLGP